MAEHRLEFQNEGGAGSQDVTEATVCTVLLSLHAAMTPERQATTTWWVTPPKKARKK